MLFDKDFHPNYTYGAWIDQKKFALEFPELVKEWEDWLDAHLDPGHYEAYKIRDQTVKPYIDGRPQWQCDVFIPAYLIQKAMELRRQRKTNEI